MAERFTNLAGTALIVGCGYLGRRLAQQLLRHGSRVYGTTLREDHAGELARLGVRPLIAEVTQRSTLAALRHAVQAELLDVYYLVPPGRPDHDPSPRQVVLEGMANVLDFLRSAHLRRAVVTSSTAVYGQKDGQRVDADTPPEPSDERAHLLLEGERQWLASGPQACVLRLAGLYGPQRIISLKALRQGSPLVGNPHGLLNLIQVDDAANLLIAMMNRTTSGRIELGCDGHPVPRIDYYCYLARKLGLGEPQVLDHAAAAQLGLKLHRLQRITSKACDNRLTCQRTGWQPRFTDFREGVDAALAVSTTPEPAGREDSVGQSGTSGIGKL